ncbi:glutathione S-transferase family protein [Rhodovulum sp. DZ06]|uniref:glutathione S-transferase family protein n=1 Tax=Rhodovulum sp. DZ06 TaxID=3425126 RepID=UPI003D335C03
MITIWGRDTSANLQAVMWTAAEIGLAVERIDWGGKFGGNDDPAYRAMAPHGKVPALRDGELTLFESPAMVRYLAAAYGDEHFWPHSPAARADLDQWAEWAKTSLAFAIINGVFVYTYRVKPSQQDPAEVARLVAAASAEARLADARIGDGPWLAGETFTWADIMMGHMLYRWYEMPVERPTDTPNLDAYYKRLCARPAFAEHVMVPFEELKAQD